MSQDAQVDPSMRMGDQRGKTRYPSPFFDISQQYIPPTVKELFKWVYFYATNNSFLGPALSKIARYPVTDVILEDPNHEVVEYWQTLLNNTLQIKTFNMEVNLDLTTYGNAFVTISYPFARHLECGSCKERHPWKSVDKKIENLVVKIRCRKCGYSGPAIIRDMPYKSLENLRMIRINPEFIDIKYNDASGRHTYLYSIPDKLKRQIMAGDPDVMEDTPLVYLEAIKKQRKIKLSSQNLYHLKRPTLAGKDMGWGMPLISTALKDLYYFYTLRRGQEAVINEHIVPFDIIFPQANGKMDPYVHTDLSSWRTEINKQLAARRRDPNYKAVMPFPVGYQRIGGDGKALMLTPELDFLSKTIVGACGIPQEFVYGGTMNWSGSSISLRTLENDFLHHRSQLLQLDIWLIERIRLYLGVPSPKSVRFSDFKMADDIQKLGTMVDMAKNRKLPWEDIQKELGRDPVIIRKKLEEEAEFDAKLAKLDMIRSAEAQAKAQQIQSRFQAKQDSAVAQAQQNQAGEPLPDPEAPQLDADQQLTIQMWARKLREQPAEMQEQTLARVAKMDPAFAEQLRIVLAQQQSAAEIPMAPAGATPPAQEKPPAKKEAPKDKKTGGADMRPMPEQKPPRRQGGI